MANRKSVQRRLDQIRARLDTLELAVHEVNAKVDHLIFVAGETRRDDGTTLPAEDRVDEVDD